MRTLISLCDYIDNIAVPNQHTADNHKNIKKYAAFVKNAMENVLTKKQRETMELYYIKGMTMTEIAALYQINKATVSKTIKIATKKIKALSWTCFVDYSS